MSIINSPEVIMDIKYGDGWNQPPYVFDSNELFRVVRSIRWVISWNIIRRY